MQVLRHKRVLFLLLALLPAFCFSNAQSGNLCAFVGVVTDSSQAVIPGASVTITNESTNLSRHTTTNGTGFYDIESLEPGTYTVTVSAQGFQSTVIKGLLVDPGRRLQTNASLTVGSISQEVTVEANALQVETESSESGSTIGAKQVSNLMLNGRNFQALGELVPGVSSVGSGSAMSTSSSGGSSTYLIVNGSSLEYTTYSIDGVEDMNTGSLTNLNVLPIIDAIQEFRILKDNYSAKYGFAGSGQVLVETKAGTATYHGSGWEFLRQSGTDATNYFSNTKTPFHQNIYGYTLGGPIPFVHRAFFFASNEWRRTATGSTATAVVPTDAQRGGDFTNSYYVGSNAGSNNVGLGLDANSIALLNSRGISDPANTCFTTNGVFNKYKINPVCFDPVAAYMIANVYPHSNYSTGNGFTNYINDNPVRLSQLDYNYRVDYQVTPNETLSTRVIYEPIDQQNPFDSYGGMKFTTITDASKITSSNMFLKLNSNLKPNMNNIATLAYSDDKPRFFVTSGPTTLSSSTPIAQEFPGADPLNRLPTISLGQGYSGINLNGAPIHASDGEWIIADDYSWVKQHHALQFGGMYVIGIKRQNINSLPNGSFGFGGQHTGAMSASGVAGDAMADFLLGLDSSYSQVSNQRSGSFHYRQFESYVQDDWKITPRLTINLGVRDVYFSPDTADGNQVTNFDPSVFSASAAPQINIDGSMSSDANKNPLTKTGMLANVTNGLVWADQNGTPSGFYTGNKTNIAPRVGFAYALDRNNTTSIRGGYGIGYSRLAMNEIYYLYGYNPPFVKTANILNSLLSFPTLGALGNPNVPNLYAVTKNPPNTQIHTYSLTAERQIIPNGIFSIAYAGSAARHTETTYYDQNWPTAVTAPSINDPRCLKTSAGQAASSAYDYDPCINSGAVSATYTRPYAGYGSIASQIFNGVSNYNALQTAFTYRHSYLQINIAYTWSKVLATYGRRTAGGGSSMFNSSTQNWRNLGAEYGPPAFDRPNVFAASVIYDLPFFRNANYLLRSTLGGWSFSGITNLESGNALSVTNSFAGAGLSARPNYAGPVHKVGTKTQWFSTNSFSAPLYGFYGTAKNGTIRAPSELGGNVSLLKNFAIRDKANVQFRAEAFNVANHPNFYGLSVAAGSGNFGAVTSALDPRVLEFALKASF